MSTLRNLYLGDLNKVLNIITMHDEDDGQAAEVDFERQGYETQFVLEVDDKLIGTTGFRAIEGSDASYWLTWTYLDPAFQGKGFGKSMLLELLDKLRDMNARKIFVKVSDYEDPDAGKIYDAAFHLYKSVGFLAELINPDFYDEDENQHILGLQFANHDSNEEFIIADEKPSIKFNQLYEIAETENAYSFSWDVEKAKKFSFSQKSFTTRDLTIGIEAVKDLGARKIFLTFPSNLPLIHKPLQAAGFNFVGQLTDYYERGVHEFHFSHHLGSI